MLSVAAATATGYITLLALDARLAILQATIADRAEALRIAQNRARVGYTSDLELRQAEAEYHATAQQVPAAQLAISRQEDALSVLVGRTPGLPPLPEDPRPGCKRPDGEDEAEVDPAAVGVGPTGCR